MNANQITKLINSLGMAHDRLVKEGTIPDEPLSFLFEGEETLGLDLEPGLELVFGSDSLRLEEITFYFTDGSITHAAPMYLIDKLPIPYDKALNQELVHRAFGQPVSSSEPFTVKGTLYRIGASDRYQVEPSLHPNSWVEFHYTRELEVERIGFSIMETEPDSTEIAVEA